jgi:hypothetical protein
VHNTCPFDSVAAIITLVYIVNPKYRQYVDYSDNSFLKFCKNIAINSTSKQTYVEHLRLLQGIFKEKDGITKIK